MGSQTLLGFYEGPLDLTDPSHYAAAAAPIPATQMLPRWAYRSKAFADLEDENIWTRTWVCIGHAAAIPNRGDLLPYTVGNHGIHVRRCEDGVLRGYFNFAQHGGCRFVPRQCQTGRKTSCFYTSCGHSRDRDVLRADTEGGDTTEMYMYRGINPLKLLPIHVATVGPLIFVNLDVTVAPVEDQLGLVASILRDRLQEPMTSVRRFQSDGAANWKLRFRCGLEGFAEEGIDPIPPAQSGAEDCDETGYWCSAVQTTATGQRLLHGAAALRDFGAARTPSMIGVFPNLLLHLANGVLGTTLLKPVGLTETTQDCEVSVMATACADDAGSALRWYRAVVLRDQAAAERLQADVAGLGNPSPFLPQKTDVRPSPQEERPLAAAFQQHLLGKLLHRHPCIERPLYSSTGHALNAGVNSGAF